jgi:hypothetical protein
MLIGRNPGKEQMLGTVKLVEQKAMDIRKDAHAYAVELVTRTINEEIYKQRYSGLRKIADAEPPCYHLEHNPPTHIVLDPGTYEYVCPGCDKTTKFVVPYITC